MSSALLRFQQASSNPSGPELIAASLEVSPQPLAITEQGNIIYRNPSFAQLVSSPGGNGPLPHSSWETTHFSVAGRDFSLVTPRIDSAERSRSDLQYFAAIGRLVAGVAHDFNNLLTGILLYCDLLQSKAGTDRALIKKTDEIRHAAEQGAGLIRQLMTVGREQPGEPASVCFDHVLADLEQLLRHLLGEQVAIEIDLRGHTERVGITSAQAQQIILNLAVNARDQCPTAVSCGSNRTPANLGRPIVAFLSSSSPTPDRAWTTPPPHTHSIRSFPPSHRVTALVSRPSRPSSKPRAAKSL